MPPYVLRAQQAMLLQGGVCIGPPLMSCAEVMNAHVCGQPSQELNHPQHKEHVWREVFHCHLLHRTVRIKRVHPARSKENIGLGATTCESVC